MSEVLAILIATAALFAGLILIGWAYGEFRPRRTPSAPHPSGPGPTAGGS